MGLAMDELTEQVGRLVDRTRARCAQLPAAAPLEADLAAGRTRDGGAPAICRGPEYEPHTLSQIGPETA